MYGNPYFVLSGFNQDIFAEFGDIFGDIFGIGSIFGGARRSARARGGRDLRYDLEIDFEEAVRGLETKIQVPRTESCEDCGGRGAAAGGLESCTDCGGQGQVAFHYAMAHLPESSQELWAPYAAGGRDNSLIARAAVPMEKLRCSVHLAATQMG